MHRDALSVRVCIQPAPQLKQNNNRTPFCPAKSSRVSVSPLQSSICSSDPNPETQEGICNAVHGHVLVEKISLSRRTEDYMFSVNTPFFFFPHTKEPPYSSQAMFLPANKLKVTAFELSYELCSDLYEPGTDVKC